MRVLVTGGPTRAYLDPVRYLSNYSSGAMAFELARELCRLGCRTAVVAGPTQQPWKSLKLASLQSVETYEQMQRSVLKTCRTFRPHVVIFAAAVLDFAPKRQPHKVSSRKPWNLTLYPTPKILDEVQAYFPKILRVGFKLETLKRADPIKFAHAYRKKKGLSLLCLNYLADIGRKSYFAYLVSETGENYRMRSKRAAAKKIAQLMLIRSRLLIEG